MHFETIENRISKVKSFLIIEQPYFGTIASYFKTIQNDDIKTFKSTPESFEYNNDYINSLNDNELGFILTNASMHQLLSHDERIGNREEWLWKLATDYAINSLLIKNGLEAPIDINYENRFEDLSSEEIYNILENEIDEEKHTPEKVSQIEYKGKIEEKNLNDKKRDLELLSKNRERFEGDMPLGIEIVVPKVYQNRISWREELFDIIESSIKFDYRLFPSNKKFLSQGIALPSLGATNIKVVVAIDSSGSINKNRLTQFLSEVEAIMNTFNSFEIDLIVADAKVQEHHILFPGDELEYTVKGGGGTNFENTFKYVDENITDVKLLLYFTDGIGKYPEFEPYYNTLWVLSNSDVKVPFGKSIMILN